jgi:hypothetical protein
MRRRLEQVVRESTVMAKIARLVWLGAVGLLDGCRSIPRSVLGLSR